MHHACLMKVGRDCLELSDPFLSFRDVLKGSWDLVSKVIGTPSGVISNCKHNGKPLKLLSLR